MSRTLKTSWLAALMLLVGTSTASSQGIGVILEWINKLSGPPFWGVGASFSTPLPGHEDRDPYFQYRLDAILHYSFNEADEVDPDDAEIRMLTLRNTVQFPVRYLPLDFGVGVSLHRFSGSDFDAFWHWSVPIQAQFSYTLSPRATLRAGPTLDVFPAFDDEDFLPVIVNVSRDDAEAVFGFFVGADFSVF